MIQRTDWKHLLSLPVIVAALGYFVDIYDLQLFGIVRVDSLMGLGVTAKEDISRIGITIIDYQMFGLLLGGILWGTLGDKFGRLSVLFGSIVTYSLANLACGTLPHITFMDKIEAYKWLRFIAGVGLAGELGAGITLVSEVLPTRLRALGTSLVAGIGLLGAVVANFTVKLSGDWTVAYYIGGSLGIALLLLRLGVVESGMFHRVSQQSHVRRGNFFSFFTNRERLIRYLKCIGIGLPTWYCIGILTYFSNDFADAFGITEKVEPGMAIMWAYLGISIGDFGSGFLSHWLHSRKKAIAWMMAGAAVVAGVYLLVGAQSANTIYFYCFLLGLTTGYWAMFVTVGAEQFGTNLRATAATTIPNMVRGMLVVMNFFFLGFRTGTFKAFGLELGSVSPQGVVTAGILVGLITFAISFYSTFTISETHGRDLDFVEE